MKSNGRVEFKCFVILGYSSVIYIKETFGTSSAIYGTSKVNFK